MGVADEIYLARKFMYLDASTAVCILCYYAKSNNNIKVKPAGRVSLRKL